MKKILIAVLAVAMLLAFSACNNETPAPKFESFTIDGKPVDEAFLNDAGYTTADDSALITVSEDGKLLVGGTGEMTGIGVYFGTKESLMFNGAESKFQNIVSAGDEYSMTIEYENGEGTVSAGGNVMTADGSSSAVMPSADGVDDSVALSDTGSIVIKMTIAESSVSYTVGDGSAKTINVTAGDDYRCGFVLWSNSDSSFDITSISVDKAE